MRRTLLSCLLLCSLIGCSKQSEEVGVASQRLSSSISFKLGSVTQVATGDVQAVDLRFRDQVVLKRGAYR